MWVQQLLLVEFAANNAILVNTRFTIFYLNAGTHPSNIYILASWWVTQINKRSSGSHIRMDEDSLG